MNRGEVWVGSGFGYAGKPRPVLVVQSDSVSTDSVVVCLITSSGQNSDNTRVRVEPSPINGLEHESWVAADKLFAFRPSQFSKRIGEVDDAVMSDVSSMVKRVLGL